MSITSQRQALARSGLLVLLASCANLRPEDAAPPSAFRFDAEVESRFPGARSILEGVDQSGERALRDGDRVLVGVEVVAGESVKRHLLELIVHRGGIGKSEGVFSWTAAPESGLADWQRRTRLLDLELVLRTPEGVEVQRSRLQDVIEFALDESFVEAIQHSQAGDKRGGLMAEMRLGLITKMLNGDPILQSLLQEAASVPWDVTLLWRRELRLSVDLDKARMAEQGDVSEPRYELPFDLFLNDSLLVRLMATVTAPYGPSGAMGGIVGLRAQDARKPDRHMSLQILGAARGPASEWQLHGVHPAYGFGDDGNGLSFSPDGRLVAMPGRTTTVEVHDLTSKDPTVARIGECSSPAADLAFLDDRTLLVVTEHEVTLFDVGAGGGALRELAVHDVAERTLCAIEIGDANTAFVGSHGAGVECWRFVADRSEPPQRESVQAPRAEALDVEFAPGTGATKRVTVTATIAPPFGWLFAVNAHRVLARTRQDEIEWRRTADGAWRKLELDRVAKPMARRRRLPDAPSTPMFDRITKGMAVVRSEATSTHAYGGGPLSLSDARRTRIHNRGRRFRYYCHGFSPDGRYYAYVSPGYRVLVDTRRFLARQLP